MTKCPSCKGRSYLHDRARDVYFVCTNCDGHGIKLIEPVQERASTAAIIAAYWRQRSENRSVS